MVRPLAVLEGETAWIETGYAHAREYTLDLIVTARLLKGELEQGTPLFCFLSFPLNADSTRFDTVYAEFNA